MPNRIAAAVSEKGLGGPPAFQSHLEEAAELFRFTRPETRLAQSLADGTSLRRSADRLGITHGSVRSRLTGIFDKTDTRSQRELIRPRLTIIAAD